VVEKIRAGETPMYAPENCPVVVFRNGRIASRPARAVATRSSRELERLGFCGLSMNT
jgi:hypothetical protein